MLIRSIKSNSKSILKFKSIPIPTTSTTSSNSNPFYRQQQQSQPFSSTSRNSFTFFNKPPPDTEKILQDLTSACNSDRLDLVSSLYPSLIKALNNSPSSSSSKSTTSTHESLTDLLAFVSKTNRFTLLLKIFDDLPKFGFKQHSKDHLLLLIGMTNTSRSSKGLKWLESMESTWGLKPDIRHWNIILDGFKREKNESGMINTFNRLIESGFKPNVSTFNTLITGYFQLGNLDAVREIKTEMVEKYQVLPDSFTHTALLTGFTKAGEKASAKQSAEELKKIVDNSINLRESVDIGILNALIKQEAIENGIEAGCKLAGEFQSSGLRLDRWTINTLVKEASRNISTMEESLELLDKLEGITRARGDKRSYSMLILGILSHPNGSIEEALKLYQEARDRSIPVDSSMIQPLLTSLLQPTPTEETFKIAKELYEDISTSSRSYSTGPDTGIYITLLKACANVNFPDLDFSRSLIQDMRERSIKLDKNVVTWHIVALMRAADDFQSAFESYDTIRSLDVNVLNLQSYNTILSAFTKLSFPASKPNSTPPSAPPLLILEFLSDMRRTQNPPDAVTYTLLLSYYSRSESTSPSSIAHIHSLIKLDINLDPDTVLFNSLMMAYSRVKAFGAAYRIWDTMRLNKNSLGSIDNVSVSIILDTCTWESERNLKTLKTQEINEKGYKIWKELNSEGFNLNLKNYESYVEYLCCCKDFEEAERVVFEDMKPSSGIGPTAEVTTLETLMKFSRRFEGKFNSLKERIQKERPDIWESVKDVARDPHEEIIEAKVGNENQVVEEEVEQSIARY